MGIKSCFRFLSFASLQLGVDAHALLVTTFCVHVYRESFCLCTLHVANVSLPQKTFFFSPFCFILSSLNPTVHSFALKKAHFLNSCRPTFRRITRNRSTEQFSGLPYVYSLLNCLICFWYGLPCVSYGVFLVATVNSIGAIFQLLYISLFITFGDKAKRVENFSLM